jgi:hypothetical protein
MNKFTTCRLVGPGNPGGIHNFGLCNQMFQIAAVLSYATDNDYRAIFPDILHAGYGPYKDTIFNKLDITSYNEDDVELEFNQPGFEYCDIPIQNNIRMHGYFQSERFFENNKQLIYDTFKPNPRVIDYIGNKYNSILDDSISCHVRLSDYVNLQDHHPILLKTNYYKNAISNTSHKNILIFSDDIGQCKQSGIFSEWSDRVTYIEGESDIIDMYTMSLCNDNIIANSTFSWWGAWLNNNSKKRIYYPDIWFGPAKTFNIKDMIPSNWTEVKCK